MSNYLKPKFRDLFDLFSYDNYDKCLYFNFQENPLYCIVTTQLFPKNSANLSEFWTAIQELVSSGKNYRHDLLRHGICVDNVCPKPTENLKECLTQYYNSKYENFGVLGQIVAMNCEGKNTDTMSTRELVLRCFTIAYFFFVILVSLWLKVSKRKNYFSYLLSSFSISDNCSILLDCKTKNLPNYMHFLQGIRFLSSTGVILAHVIFGHNAIAVSNPWQVEQNSQSFIYTAIVNASGNFVHALFVISSYLLTIQFLNELKRNGEVRWSYVVRYILKSYIRLTSGQIVILLGVTSSFFHFSGPFTESLMGSQNKICSKNWWINLLYLTNIITDNGICLPYTWFLSVNFHLTIIGLLLLWMAQKDLKKILGFVAKLICFKVVFMSLYMFWNNYEISIIYNPEMTYKFQLMNSKEWQATWASTVSNLGSLASGLYFGYLYVKQQQKPTKFWSLASTSLILVPTLCSSCYMTSDYYSKSGWPAAFYGTVQSIVISFGLGNLIYGFSLGKGVSVRKYLEWGPMHTLGQLSFGVYLVHFLFILLPLEIRKTPNNVSYYLWIHDTAAVMLGANALSAVMTVFVLLPLDSLLKKLLR